MVGHTLQKFEVITEEVTASGLEGVALRAGSNNKPATWKVAGL